MNILIAPNAFKNSLSAQAAANAIRRGLEQSSLLCNCTCFPIADGGDGTGDLLIDRVQAIKFTVPVQDPIGRPIVATFGLSGGPVPTAIVEMASASGLSLLHPDERHPLLATSVGTGQLLRAAIDNGARHILLAVGGSATVDGGAGILHALGMRFLDASGNALTPEPARMMHLDRLEYSHLIPGVLQATLTILCDVTNPLLGPNGAAAIFGPQKGADPWEVIQLEAFLTRWKDVVLAATRNDMTQVAHGGAAGGTAAGLQALLGAQLVSGADYFLDITQFDAVITNADLVITGEGSLDAQTLEGKGPLAVARRARTRKIPVIGMAGQVPPQDFNPLKGFFDDIITINDPYESLEQSIQHTEQNLVRSAQKWGDRFTLHRTTG